jgi:hypothetical protein
MLTSTFSWIQKNERHLSAGAVFAGFVVDNIFFTRVDVLETHAVFALYTVLCLFSILLLHAVESRACRSGKPLPRWRSLLPILTQFALGGFWSGFVIFYGRAADFGASWLFLLVLVAVFLGGEYFHTYHSRLVFTSTLFFFALYSYSIFAVPIYTGTIGTPTFLLSSIVAVGGFLLFTKLLRLVAREQFIESIWRVRAGVFFVAVLMNVFYFTNILPPLPLSAEVSGVYHSVTRMPGVYLATDEHRSWKERLGFTKTFHLPLPGTLSAYSSVFAPTKLSTLIVHRWQWYNEGFGSWETRATIPYTIVGGRDGGYRGYSTVTISRAGTWRVVIETKDGRRIARIAFRVYESETVPEQREIVLD